MWKKQSSNRYVRTNNQVLEQVSKVKYLDTNFEDGKIDKELEDRRKNGKTAAPFQ